MAERPPPLPIGRNEQDPSAIADKNAVEEALNKKLLAIGFYVVFLVVVGILLFTIPSLMPPEENIGTWVERFGALVAILSLSIDSQLKKADEYLNSAAMCLPLGLFQSLTSSYSYILYLEKASLCFAIVGAVVWAYGSVIIFWASNAM
jgi:hypothetical protein